MSQAGAHVQYRDRGRGAAVFAAVDPSEHASGVYGFAVGGEATLAEDEDSGIYGIATDGTPGLSLFRDAAGRLWSAS